MIAFGTFMVDAEHGVIYGARGRPLRGRVGGYMAATDSRGSTLAHRLIWEAVNGPIPDGLQINHINGLKDDNRISNLELVTPSGNMQHALSTGLARPPRGKDHHRAKLTDSQVHEIRASNLGPGELGKRYGVRPGTIYGIKKGTDWRHLLPTATDGSEA